MIARLRGELIESSFNSCVIEAGGVGFEAAIPLSTFDRLPRVGEQVTLLVLTQLREDAITLFGFATPEEKRLFQLLISVSGVGGKIALAVLGGMSPDNFCDAVVRADAKTLSRIPGIGKRMAERLIVELKDKVMAPIGAPGSVTESAPDGSARSAFHSAAADAAQALEQLGFKRDAVNKVLNSLAGDLPPEEHTSENLLRAALTRLKP